MSSGAPSGASVAHPQPRNAIVDAAVQATSVARQILVVLVASDTSQEALRIWAQRHQFDLSASYGGETRDPADFAFHCTLVASANQVLAGDGEIDIEPIAVPVVGFDVLGRDRDVPVLKLADRDGRLQELRDVFVETLGIEPTFPEFKPHVSLSYAWTGTPDLDTLDVPNMSIVFDRLYIAELGA